MSSTIRTISKISAACVATTFLVAIPRADAIVGGTRDCQHNELGEPGSGCSFPTIGALMGSEQAPSGGLRSFCTVRLISNSPTRAVILTAAHCALEMRTDLGDGVTFDSQTVDDSVNPYGRDVVMPDRIIVPDAIITHPFARSSLEPSVDPPGNSALYSRSDFTLLVIDHPDKLARLQDLWALPYGDLVDLPPVDYVDTLSPQGFRDLALWAVGYGRDWLPPGGPGGQVNVGRQDGNNGGFRTVARLTLVGHSRDRLITSEMEQKDQSGTCGGDSGTSAFVPAPGGDVPMILAMPTWGGIKCAATTQWTRLDRPNALKFLSCGFAAEASQIRSCITAAFNTPPI